MNLINISDVKFGAPVTCPGKQQKTVTGFQSANGFEIVFNEGTGLLAVSNKDGNRKLYPITNIKEMTPACDTETKKRGRPIKEI